MEFLVGLHQGCSRSSIFLYSPNQVLCCLIGRPCTFVHQVATEHLVAFFKKKMRSQKWVWLVTMTGMYTYYVFFFMCILLGKNENKMC